MFTSMKWTEKMKFTADCDGHLVPVDAKSPIGDGSAVTPKHLVLVAIAGCTAMDVIALMRKYRQEVKTFTVEADAPMKEGHPAVFKDVMVTYKIHGNVEKEKVLEAARLSMTKYCGVSAMIAKACPINYKVEVNDELVGEGQAQFD